MPRDRYIFYENKNEDAQKNTSINGKIIIILALLIIVFSSCRYIKKYNCQKIIKNSHINNLDGNYDEVMAISDPYVDACGNNIHFLMDRAVAFTGQLDSQNAIISFNKILEIDSDHWWFGDKDDSWWVNRNKN